ncbi:uncharacterized protein LOC144108277 [Amblyomma americanum]
MDAEMSEVQEHMSSHLQCLVKWWWGEEAASVTGSDIEIGIRKLYQFGHVQCILDAAIAIRKGTESITVSVGDIKKPEKKWVDEIKQFAAIGCEESNDSVARLKNGSGFAAATIKGHDMCSVGAGSACSPKKSQAGQRRFVCPECGYATAVCWNFKAHLRIHSGEKPYKCQHCSKSFTDRSNMLKHVRIHTGKKPFQCTHCSKTFSRKDFLSIHLRIHTGERPYQCNLCQLAFTHKMSLNRHVKTHNK